MIGKEVTAVHVQDEVGDSPEPPLRSLDPSLVMGHPEIDNRAGEGLPSPGQKGFIVLVNEANGPVDKVGLGLDKDCPHALHKLGKFGAGYVVFANHQTPGRSSPEQLINCAVMPGLVFTELMGVGPVDLAIR